MSVYIFLHSSFISLAWFKPTNIKFKILSFAKVTFKHLKTLLVGHDLNWVVKCHGNCPFTKSHFDPKCLTINQFYGMESGTTLYLVELILYSCIHVMRQ